MLSYEGGCHTVVLNKHIGTYIWYMSSIVYHGLLGKLQ